MNRIILSFLFLLSCATPGIKPRIGTDFHMHIHHPGEVQDDVQYTGDRALLAADSIDLSRAVVISRAYSSSISEKEAQKENDFVLEEASRHPLKLAGACAVNPVKKWAINEAIRCSKKGAKVLKLHLMASGMDLKKASDYQRAHDFLQGIEKLSFTVLIHANYPRSSRGDELSALIRLINSFPQIRWMIGHGLGREFQELSMISHQNFFVEISIVPLWCKNEEDRLSFVKTMREVGVDKFVFGSDWPVLHPAEMKKAFERLPLTREEKEKVLWSNGGRLDDLFL